MIVKKKYYIITIGTFPALLTLVHVLIFQKLSPRVVLEEVTIDLPCNPAVVGKRP